MSQVMTEENHSKLDIASSQLETAIGLFVSGRCPFSAITLAGAADTILSQLVVNAGKEPFVDYVRAVEEAASGVTPPRGKMGTHINNTLNINALKHMDPTDDEFVALNPEECAVGAILKAVANYKQLVDKEPDFIKAFLYWTWQNLDRDKIMENYEKHPEKLKQRHNKSPKRSG